MVSLSNLFPNIIAMDIIFIVNFLIPSSSQHYGKEIIAKEVQLESDHPDVHRLYLTVYKNFIEVQDLYAWTLPCFYV